MPQGCDLLLSPGLAAARERVVGQSWGRGSKPLAGAVEQWCETLSPICWQQFNPSWGHQSVFHHIYTFLYHKKFRGSSTAGFNLVADAVIWCTCPFEYNPAHCPGFNAFRRSSSTHHAGKGGNVTQLLMPFWGWPLCTCSAECFSSGKVSWVSWVPGSCEYVRVCSASWMAEIKFTVLQSDTLCLLQVWSNSYWSWMPLQSCWMCTDVFRWVLGKGWDSAHLAMHSCIQSSFQTPLIEGTWALAWLLWPILGFSLKSWLFHQCLLSGTPWMTSVCGLQDCLGSVLGVVWSWAGWLWQGNGALLGVWGVWKVKMREKGYCFLQTSLLSAFSLLPFVSFPFGFVRTRMCSRESKIFAGEMGWEMLSLWKEWMLRRSWWPVSGRAPVPWQRDGEPTAAQCGGCAGPSATTGGCRAGGGTEPPSSCLAPCSLWLSALRYVMTLGVWHLCCTGLKVRKGIFKCSYIKLSALSISDVK